MTDDDEDARGEHDPLVAGDGDDDGDRDGALEQIEDGGGENGVDAADLEEVAGADVAIADGAQVDPVAIASEEPGEGNRTCEEAEEQCGDVDSHKNAGAIVRPDPQMAGGTAVLTPT